MNAAFGLRETYSNELENPGPSRGGIIPILSMIDYVPYHRRSSIFMSIPRSANLLNNSQNLEAIDLSIVTTC